MFEKNQLVATQGAAPFFAAACGLQRRARAVPEGLGHRAHPVFRAQLSKRSWGSALQLSRAARSTQCKCAGAVARARPAERIPDTGGSERPVWPASATLHSLVADPRAVRLSGVGSVTGLRAVRPALIRGAGGCGLRWIAGIEHNAGRVWRESAREAATADCRCRHGGGGALGACPAAAAGVHRRSLWRPVMTC